MAFFDANPAFVELLIQERAEFKDRKNPTYFEHRDANVGSWQELLLELTSDGRVRDGSVQRIRDVLGEPTKIRDIVLKRHGGALVYLRNVAQVEDGFKEQRRLVEVDRRPALMVAVQKRSGANAVRVN